MDWPQLLCNEKPQKSPGSMYTCLVPSSCQSFLASISAPDIWCFGYLWVLSLYQQYSIEDSNLRKPNSYLSYLASSPTSPFPLIGRYIVQHEPTALGSLRHSVCGEIWDRLIIIFRTNRSPICSPQHSGSVLLLWRQLESAIGAFGIPNDLSKSTSSFLLTGKSIMSCRNRTWPWIRICVKMCQISHPCEPWCLELTIW